MSNKSNMSMKNMERKEWSSMNGDDSRGVSICIPRVFRNITKERISRVLEMEGLGDIDRVDLVTVSERFNIAYIHFKPNTWRERGVLESLVRGDDVKLYYEDRKPWYWKLSISKSRKPVYGERRRRLVIDSISNSTPSNSPTLNPRGIDNAPAWQGDGGKAKVIKQDDKHADNAKAKTSTVSYGRTKPLHHKVKRLKTKDEDGLRGFFAAVEKRRTYESACKLAYERRKELPETFEFPEEGASDGVKKAFTRAVYSKLGM